MVSPFLVRGRQREVEDDVEIVQCPRCQVTMREREQGNVIIDICPQCRGVWLDPGELEKLSIRESRYYDDDDDDDDDWDDRRRGEQRRDTGGFSQDRRNDSSGSRGAYQQKKKKGFLSSMMENFGGEGGDD